MIEPSRLAASTRAPESPSETRRACRFASNRLPIGPVCQCPAAAYQSCSGSTSCQSLRCPHSDASSCSHSATRASLSTPCQRSTVRLRGSLPHVKVDSHSGPGRFPAWKALDPGSCPANRVACCRVRPSPSLARRAPSVPSAVSSAHLGREVGPPVSGGCTSARGPLPQRRKR